MHGPLNVIFLWTVYYHIKFQSNSNIAATSKVFAALMVILLMTESYEVWYAYWHDIFGKYHESVRQFRIRATHTHIHIMTPQVAYVVINRSHCHILKICPLCLYSPGGLALQRTCRQEMCILQDIPTWLRFTLYSIWWWMIHWDQVSCVFAHKTDLILVHLSVAFILDCTETYLINL